MSSIFASESSIESGSAFPVRLLPRTFESGESVLGQYPQRSRDEISRGWLGCGSGFPDHHLSARSSAGLASRPSSHNF